MKREKRKTRDLYGGRSEGEWFSIWGINATVCARLDLRLFAPLAFLFLEGDEMEREREKGLGIYAAAAVTFPHLRVVFF